MGLCSSLRLLRMMAVRELMVVACRWLWSLLVAWGGSLKLSSKRIMFWLWCFLVIMWLVLSRDVMSTLWLWPFVLVFGSGRFFVEWLYAGIFHGNR